VSDLVEYRRFRKDRSVVMAARSLLNALREINPAILQRKLRGKFYDADAKPRAFGESKATDGVDGAELLQELEQEERQEEQLDEEMEGYDSDGGENGGEGADDDDDDDDDVDDEEMAPIPEEGEDDDDEEEEAKHAPQESENGGKLDGEDKKSKRPLSRAQKKELKEVKAMEEFQSRKRAAPKIPQSERIDSKRILTEEDFLRIRELKRKAEQLKKDPLNRRKKERPSSSSAAGRSQAGRSQAGRTVGTRTVGTRVTEFSSVFENSDDEDEDAAASNPAIMLPGNLEGSVRRKRKALAERLESVYKGREEEAEKGKRSAGMSNLQKEKTTKNFLMTMKSRKVKVKQTMSLRQQQLTLKKHIKTIEKKKKLIQKVRRKGGR
jgi:protein SDA1